MVASVASGQFLDSTAPFTGSLPCTLGILAKPTSWGTAFLYTLYNSSVSATKDIVSISGDQSGSTTGSAANIAGPSFGSQATTTANVTLSAWGLFLSSFNSSQAAAYYNGTSKGTSSSQSPTGINRCRIGTRADGNNHYVGLCGFSFGFTRVLTDLEISFLCPSATNFNHPRALQSLIHFCRMNQGNANADVGSMNFTATGVTFVNTDSPVIASFYTGTAIPDQVWTQNTAITSVADGFEDVSSAFTEALYLIGAAGTAIAASGAGSVSRTVVLGATPNASFIANNYVTVGAGALTRILAVSGTSVLVASDQTWNNGDTVTPYPVSSQTIAGMTFTAGISGTPTGTLAQTSNYFKRAVNNTTATLVADSNLFKITINAAAGGGTPGFTAAAAVVSANTDGYTFGGTPNQTATAYLVAMLCDSAAPTNAQVKTGSPTGFVSRVSLSVTSGVAFTNLTIGSLTNPLYDYYIVLDNGNGTSAVSGFPALRKLPAAGRQYQTLGSISATSPFLGVAAASDVLDIVLLSPSGYNVVPNAAGEVEVDVNGDNSRQLLAFNGYSRASKVLWYTADSILPFNDQPPQPNGNPNAAFRFLLGAGSTVSLDVTGTMTDPEGDTITWSEAGNILSGLGLTQSGGTISGTTVVPTAPATFVVANPQITGSDPYNEATTVTGLIVVGAVPMPDLSTAIGTPQIDPILATVYLTANYTTANDTQSPPRAAGVVIAQDTPTSQLIQVGSTVNLTLSSGITQVVTGAVPDVSSSPTTQAAATAALVAAGFGVVVPQPWAGTLKISQYPPAGTILQAGSNISLFSALAAHPRPQPRKKKIHKPAPAQKLTRITVKPRPKKR